jgi:hypothetical protein
MQRRSSLAEYIAGEIPVFRNETIAMQAADVGRFQKALVVA